MIKQMKNKFQSEDKLDLRLSQSSSLPLKSETVDYVFANMYLHHTETPDVALTELVRILKVGGVLVITYPDQHEHEFLRVEHHNRWLGFKREDIIRLFTVAGLKQVGVVDAEETCSADSNCGSQKATVNIFVASERKDSR
jgi:ubiquinone/menaquinone biosynthesis C-methylase UbiE